MSHCPECGCPWIEHHGDQSVCPDQVARYELPPRPHGPFTEDPEDDRDE